MLDWIPNAPPIGYEYIFIYTKNYIINYIAQVIYFYCTSNIYLKFFLCETTLCKWHMYEIVTLVNYKFIIMSMHLLYKFKQVYFSNSLFIMQLPDTRVKLMALKIILTLKVLA